MLAADGLVPPTTLDGLRTAAKALNDPAANVAGFVTRGDGVQALYTLAPFLFAYGGRWLDDKGKPELASAPFINALKYYSDILRSAGPPNVLGMQWKTTYPLFQQERAAMFGDAVNFLAYFRDPAQSRIVDKVGMMAVPAGPSGSHSTVIAWGPAIAASSKKQQAAWYVIQWLTSKRNMLAASVAILAVMGFPLLYLCWMSLHRWSMIGFEPPRFVGFANFLQLADDGRFVEALGRTFWFTALGLASNLPLGLGIALLMHERFAGRSICRALLILPMVATPAAMGLVWVIMLDPTLGIVRYLLGGVGIAHPPLWLSDPDI